MRRQRFEGGKALDDALGQFKPSTGKNILRRVGREALKPFDEAWRDKAPFEWGDLQDSGGVGSDVAKRDRRQSTVEIYAGPGRNPQAIQREFGNKRSAPDPFARPAWDNTKDQVLANVETGLGAEIEKTAKRVAKRASRLKG